MTRATKPNCDPILVVEDLSLAISTHEGDASILDHANLVVEPGEIMGLVGESGCGKSTLVRAVLQIQPKTARITGGGVIFQGENLLALPEERLSRDVRARRIGFIPQDPYLALNPLFRLGTQLLEIWRWHAGGTERSVSSASGRARLLDLFARVRLPDPEAILSRYPHELSGGQRQRVLIAAALLCGPELIIADEPTTALDVTTQQQILMILRALADEFDVAVLFVTHDFGVVAELCTRVTVMYAGQTIECGPTREVLFGPKHPYTERLIACHPDRLTALDGIPGAVPSLITPPSGCRFHPRCDDRMPGCSARTPNPRNVAANHQVDCIKFDRIPT